METVQQVMYAFFAVLMLPQRASAFGIAKSERTARLLLPQKCVPKPL